MPTRHLLPDHLRMAHGYSIGWNTMLVPFPELAAFLNELARAGVGMMSVKVCASHEAGQYLVAFPWGM